MQTNSLSETYSRYSDSFEWLFDSQVTRARGAEVQLPDDPEPHIAPNDSD